MKKLAPNRHGFTLVELLVAIAIIGVLIGLILVGASRARDAAARAQCGNNLRQIGLALHMYAQRSGTLPAGMNGPGREYPFLSWSVRIVPFLDQAELWRQAQVDFGTTPTFWTPPRHRGESVSVPIFLCPSGQPDSAFVDPQHGVVAFRHYLGVSGTNQFSKDGVFFTNSRIKLVEISDGTSNTIAVGERLPSADLRFGWWYAGIGQGFDGSADHHLGVRELRTTFRAPMCERGPWHFQPGAQRNMCDTFHFWSSHSGGANFAFCDGSVRFLSYSADPLMPALATRHGSEKIAVPE